MLKKNPAALGRIFSSLYKAEDGVDVYHQPEAVAFLIDQCNDGPDDHAKYCHWHHCKERGGAAYNDGAYAEAGTPGQATEPAYGQDLTIQHSWANLSSLVRMHAM